MRCEPARAGLFVAVASLTAALACRAVRPPLPEPHPRGRGTVGVEVIPDPDALKLRLSAGEEFRRPAPHIGNHLPDYPKELEPLRLAEQVVAVRIVINEEGTVIAIEPSPVARSTGGPHAEPFERVVRAAVASWRFTPAVVRRIEDGPDRDGDGQADYQYVREEASLKVLYDLRFIFRIEDGRGVVATAAIEAT